MEYYLVEIYQSSSAIINSWGHTIDKIFKLLTQKFRSFKVQ